MAPSFTPAQLNNTLATSRRTVTLKWKTRIEAEIRKAIETSQVSHFVSLDICKGPEKFSINTFQINAMEMMGRSSALPEGEAAVICDTFNAEDTGFMAIVLADETPEKTKFALAWRCDGKLLSKADMELLKDGKYIR